MTATGQDGRAVLAVLCGAQLAFILDISVVNVALVPLARELHAGPATLQLVAAVYAAAFGGVLLLGGRIADRGRARDLFITGLLIFAASSAVCGAAPGVAVLVAGRGLQGAGAGLASPAALALLTTSFAEGPARNRALGTWAAVAAAGGAIGLLAGGALVASVGWRAVFYVNVPVVAVIVAVAPRVLRRDAATGPAVGQVAVSAAMAGAAVVLAVIALSVLQQGQPALGVPLLADAAAAAVAQRAADRRAEEPLIPVSVLRARPVLLANVVTALLSAVVLGVNFFLALYLQGPAGLSPFATGLAFLPVTAISAATALLASRAVARAGAGRLLAAGMAAIGAGCLMLAASAGGSYAEILPGLGLVAAGMGPGFTVTSIAATGGVPASAQGAAAALLSASTQAGAAVGLVVLSLLAAVPASRIAGYRLAYLFMAAGALTAAGTALRLPGRRAAAASVTSFPTHASSCLPGSVQAISADSSKEIT